LQGHEEHPIVDPDRIEQQLLGRTAAFRWIASRLRQLTDLDLEHRTWQAGAKRKPSTKFHGSNPCTKALRWCQEQQAPDEKGFWGRDAQTSVIDDVVIWGIGEADLAVKEHGNHEKMHEMNLLHSS